MTSERGKSEHMHIHIFKFYRIEHLRKISDKLERGDKGVGGTMQVAIGSKK